MVRESEELFDGPADARLTVLLIDDSRSQAVRIQDCLGRYRIQVRWRRSYRAAAELLRDPDESQLIDLILIDQAFESAAATSLLGHSEIAELGGADSWDVLLHQGLFIMARLSQDMREGLIPGTRMMILTHYARVEIAAQVGLAGYESKRRLLSDPYTALKDYLPHMRPSEADVERRLTKLAATAGLDRELNEQIRQAILDGLDPDEVCAAVSRLDRPSDWRSVGRGLERLAAERRAFQVQRLERALVTAWLPSPEGWQHIRQLETLGPLGCGFEAFRARIGRPQSACAALLAVRAVLTTSAPCMTELRRGFGLVRQVDPRCRPLRLRDRSWTILGAWLAEPPRPAGRVAATSRSMLSVTRHVQDLHARGLAHGSLTPLTTCFAPPLFGGLRWLAGEHDLDSLRWEDRRRLAALGAATFENVEAEPSGAVRWAEALEAGDFDRAARAIGARDRRADPPTCVDFAHAWSGEAAGFRDLLMASLGPEDVLLRDVDGETSTSPPLDFVVCAGGALTVIEHRSRYRSVVVEHGAIVEVEGCQRVKPPEQDPEPERLVRALARCRRSADLLAERVETGLGLPRGMLRRQAAIVVSGRAEVRSPAGRGWRPVMTEAEATAELNHLSRGPGRPSGTHMLPHLPRPRPVLRGRPSGTRALHWTTVPLSTRMGVTMRTWSKRWPPDAWRALLTELAVGRRALDVLPPEERPLPLLELRAYDCNGRPGDLEGDPAAVEVVEYDVEVPPDAAPLPVSATDAGGESGRRRLAVAVLRGVIGWEGRGLAYRMEPDGLLHDGHHVYCDLLQSVGPADPHRSRRQRLGAASCLMLLLSPWPFAWAVPLAGTVPALPERPNEGSAWGIGATAVAALLDPDAEPGRLRILLSEAADLLEAAARLGPRFPSWPAGLAVEGQR